MLRNLETSIKAVQRLGPFLFH